MAAAEMASPLPIPRLDNGLPATFVAVTREWEAVEVDTASGGVIGTIGQIGDLGESEDEGVAANALQQVWRTTDHNWYIVSVCCEPAAGIIYFVAPGETLTPEGQTDASFTFGWSATPSPFDDRYVTTGYSMEVAAVDGQVSFSLPIDDVGGYGDGVATWDRTGRAIAWVANDWAREGGATLLRVDLDDPSVAPAEIELTWVEPGEWIDGIGTQESGNYVAFVHAQDSNPESPAIVATEGVVFSPGGELIAEFAVETGSRWGGYDPSGRLLIYTDGDDIVRWQGRGQSGVLGEGFIHASW